MQVASGIISSDGCGTAAPRFSWSASRRKARSGGFLRTAQRPCASRARKSRSPRASAVSTNIPDMPTAPSLRDGSRRAVPFDRGVFLVHGEEAGHRRTVGAHRRADRSRRPRIFRPILDDIYELSTAGAHADRRRPTAAGLRRSRSSISIGTTTCRNSSSTSTNASTPRPMIALAASSSAGSGARSRLRPELAAVDDPLAQDRRFRHEIENDSRGDSDYRLCRKRPH